MTGPSFDGMGPFKEGLTLQQRFDATVDLEEALRFETHWRALDALYLLGHVSNPYKRAQALQLLNGIGSLPIRHALARLHTIEKKRRLKAQEVA